MKRQQAAADRTQPAKKLRSEETVDPALLKQCTAVSEGIEQATHIPSIAQEMIKDMLKFSLCVFKEDRQRFQESHVDSVGKILSEVEAGIQKDIENAEAKVSSSESERSALQSEVEQAEAKMGSADSELKEKKYGLSDVAMAFRGAKKPLAAAEDAQVMGDKELVAAANKKQTLETAEATLVKPLADGNYEQVDVEKGMSELLAVLAKFEFDKSMETALPTALGKPPAERGQFDEMVVVQLTQEMTTRIQALSKLLDEGEPAKAERSAAVEAAKQELAAASERQMESADVFSAAKRAQELCERALDSARQALKDFGPETKKRVKALEAENKRLAKFHEGPLKAFGELKDRTHPVEPAPAPVEDVVVPEVVEEEKEAAPEATAMAMEEVAPEAAIEVTAEPVAVM